MSVEWELSVVANATCGHCGERVPFQECEPFPECGKPMCFYCESCEDGR